jgi:aerobic carbon-monoxide dehydrogenase medium subunit
MKAAAFDYVRPSSLAEALSQIGGGAGVKPLAGGQSLGPMMNLRIAKPDKLVDISQLAELNGQSETAGSAVIGACVTHAEIEDGKIRDPACGFLKHVAGRIAYRAVRNMGTIGGAIAHADPAADWLCALTATGATLIVAEPLAEHKGAWFSWLRGGPSSPKGVRTRRIDIRAFITGPYTTSLRAGELLIGVEIPKASPEMRWGYVKFCRKVGELADAIGAVTIDPQRRFARIVAGAVGGTPLLLKEATRKLAATAAAPPFDEILNEIGEALPRLDAVKRQHVAVTVERAIAEALRV